MKLDEDALRTTREMFNVGQAGEPEVIHAQVQERRAKVALQKAENRFRGDWEELVSLVGSPDYCRRRLKRSRSRPRWHRCLSTEP